MTAPRTPDAKIQTTTPIGGSILLRRMNRRDAMIERLEADIIERLEEEVERLHTIVVELIRANGATS